jgi:hypothetical protein
VDLVDRAPGGDVVLDRADREQRHADVREGDRPAASSVTPPCAGVEGAASAGNLQRE